MVGYRPPPAVQPASGLFAFRGGREPVIYVGGLVGIAVVVLSVLIIVGVLPTSKEVVGGMFLALAIGLFGPFVDRWGRVAP